MSNVVWLKDQARAPTARAKLVAAGRAANLVNKAAVTPPARARRVAKIADHQSDGMLSRCHHLETSAAVQSLPTSEAMASRETHKSMTDRNEAEVMTESLGQIVLDDKDPVSSDWPTAADDTRPMSKPQSKSQYKDDFIARVRRAREARGLTQNGIAELLGIDQGKYKQYESRSYLPHDLIPRFCLACGVDHGWLFTGKGKGPLTLPHPRESRVKSPQQKRTRAA